MPPPILGLLVKLPFTLRNCLRSMRLSRQQEQFCEAEKVLQAYRQSSTGVTVLDGIVEKPVIDRMTRILNTFNLAKKNGEK